MVQCSYAAVHFKSRGILWSRPIRSRIWVESDNSKHWWRLCEYIQLRTQTRGRAHLYLFGQLVQDLIFCLCVNFTWPLRKPSRLDWFGEFIQTMVSVDNESTGAAYPAVTFDPLASYASRTLVISSRHKLGWTPAMRQRTHTHTQSAET